MGVHKLACIFGLKMIFKTAKHTWKVREPVEKLFDPEHIALIYNELLPFLS
ncbi:MAG: hypothetical protein ACH346_05545 [Chthoniobacterales bacterium]